MITATRAKPFQNTHQSHAFYPLNTAMRGVQFLWKSSFPYLCIGWIALLLFGSLLFVHWHSVLRRSHLLPSQQTPPDFEKRTVL
ncbi:hypothetical protein [Oscillatoria sp. FACHB-1407]|uniref:hypothetical protein n=1 Tax=Oscillatoria sp. FACHB-1407 TaxID=2692847 RepID=UPI0016894A14|nr:hypothetical protein [Oscillatoria sp. FACHB-1407]